jgi:hypothetical protein
MFAEILTTDEALRSQQMSCPLAVYFRPKGF